MIRAARHTDIPRLEALLHEMHGASKYAGRVAISARAMRDTLMHLLHFQGGTVPGGTCFFVAETAGTVEGFIVGQLDRVYHIGNKMMAQDVFFYLSPRGWASDAFHLLDAYAEWATGNPKVLEINLSWNDTMPGAERLPALFERKGFVKTGEIFERRTDSPVEDEPVEEEAA